MRHPLLLLALFAASGMPLAAEHGAETCEQLRAQIGAVPPGNADLLRRLAGRNQECAFTSAEFYKAAYGDRPPAPISEPSRRSEEREDDDD